MKIFDILPGWAWALIVFGLVLACGGLGLQIANLKVDVAHERAQAAQWETALNKRIAAESQAIANAVQAARAEELAKFKAQQEKTDALRQENARARAELNAANGRMRDAIDRAAAARSSCGDLSQPGAGADGVENEEVTRFKAAGRKLTERILQLTGDGDEAIGERNLCIDLLPTS